VPSLISGGWLLVLFDGYKKTNSTSQTRR